MQSTISSPAAPEFITVRELAQISQFSIDWLRELVRRGELGQPMRRRPTGKMLLRRAEALRRLGLIPKEAAHA